MKKHYMDLFSLRMLSYSVTVISFIFILIIFIFNRLWDRIAKMTKYHLKTIILSVICLFCGYCMYFLDNVSVRKEFFALQGKRNDTKEFTNKIQSFPEKSDTSFELSQDINVMIRDIREKFIAERPLISSAYVACTDKTVEGIEDILCMVS